MAFVEQLHLRRGEIAIEVRRAHLEACWPPKTTPADSAPGGDLGLIPVKSGLPGRPTSWHLIEAQFRKRWAVANNSEKKSKSLAAWVSELAAWLKEKHPEATRCTEKTIKNALRPVLAECQKTVGSEPA